MQPMRIEHLILRYGTKFRARKELYFVPKQTNISESEKSKVFIVCNFAGRLKFYMLALVAQWIERLPPEQEVEGSNPFKGTFLLAYPLQRVDHFY